MGLQLTIEFLQNILKKYKNDESLSIKNFEVANAVDVGENFVADVKKVSVFGSKKYNENETEFNIDLIIKFILDNPAVEEFMPVTKLFHNEMVAYNKLIPELKKYSSDGKLPVADCIYADKSYIVMKNLCVEGYKIIDKHKGFEIDQIESILKALAKFHSTSLIMSEKSPEKFKQLAKSIEEAVYDPEKPVLKASQEIRAEIAIRIFEEIEDVRDREKIYEALNKIKNYDAETTLFKERKYRVLNHGDTWSNNILIKNNEIILIDLQVMRFTSVACDLSYFLNVNVRPGVRKVHFDRFLRVYLKALNGHLNQAGCDLNLSLDWLKGEIDDFSLYGISCSLLFTPVFCFKKEDLNISLFDMEEVKSIEFQWKLVTPAYKENVIENVLEYMRMFQNY